MSVSNWFSPVKRTVSSNKVFELYESNPTLLYENIKASFTWLILYWLRSTYLSWGWMKVILKLKQPKGFLYLKRKAWGLLEHIFWPKSLAQEIIAENRNVILEPLVLGNGYFYLLPFKGNRVKVCYYYLFWLLSVFELWGAADHTGMPYEALDGRPWSWWAVKLFQNHFRTVPFASETGRVGTPFLKDAWQVSQPRRQKRLESAFCEPSHCIKSHSVTTGLQFFCLHKLVLDVSHSTKRQKWSSANSHVLSESLKAPGM